MNWQSLTLLALATLLYAGYNLFVKQSADQVGPIATTTIGATIALQAAALATSLVFALLLRYQGVHTLSLPGGAYLWAIAGGLCIGVAEILYFYLFAGFAGAEPVKVAVATPTIVSGTIVIALIAAWLVFGETIRPAQWLGAGLVVLGLMLLFRTS